MIGGRRENGGDNEFGCMKNNRDFGSVRVTVARHHDQSG
jgi:hypothetical protein